ncbi:MAG: SPOR domain-containing protein [Pseudomonadota bacterium]
MTFRFSNTLRPITLLLSLLLLPMGAWAAAEDAILLIDQTSGVAGVQRNGKRLALQPGEALQEQDLIVTDRSGRMTLRLGRHGFVEVGPNAEVGIERLPFAAYARDLKSIFSVSKGYFRVVWKHPQLSTNWPLYVYMAGHRVSLVSGEYFFQNSGAEQRACVAAGQLVLQAAGVEKSETIKPPSCVQLGDKKLVEVTPRSPEDWIAVRRGFSIEATAVTLLAREGAAAEPLPAAASKPVITTVPVATASVAAPTPIVLPAPNTELLAAEPQLATSAAAAPALAADAPGLGPVIAAPVLAAPTAAPRTAMSPALPVFTPPIYPAPAVKLAVASPIIIGQIQAAPATPPAPVAKPAAAAPIIAKPLPVAAPTPAALAASQPKAAAAGSWALNVASYSDAAVAEREVQRLRAAGYASAVSQPATINGKAWHRVQISGYANETAARGAAVEIKTRLGQQNIWVIKP